MPYAPSGNADIYYEDYGTGEAIIAVHGLIENTSYFTLTGVCESLANHYRVIPMDMRAHGKTKVHGEPWGYDDETIGKDIEALADHLGLSRFHILSHSTGGFASSRYAMENSHRLSSLILTDTSSATNFFQVKDDGVKFHDTFAKSFEKHDWEKIMVGIKMQPFPFFRGIAERKDNQAMYDLAYEMIKVGDRHAIGAFIRSFYTDPDPRVEGLRKISCPTLVLVGEKDDLFLEPSRLMNREIPDCTLIVFENCGHMLAIEDPERMSREILDFLKAHPDQTPL
ncbi:MAG: alpha/beta hydrolase [Proteobacteria bacterium]|nr:alpha/beta hydrolase [Pseudomonadota bacterium]